MKRSPQISLVTLLLILLVQFIFIPLPKTYAATTPSLGEAASFGILSSTYSNTVGGTTISGDLGYTTGPAVAPTVTGTTFSPPSSKYTTAGTDQNSALSDLASQPCTTTFPAGPVDLATDTTGHAIGVYPPGVYCTTAASAVSIGSGTITLSGSGTYIFRIDGALTTAANTFVITADGASPCDVFWTPTSATTLGANSTFVGTVIDAAGITIGSTVTWAGRALAFGGTVTTTTDTISSTACTAATTPTPIPNTTSSTSSSSNGETAPCVSSGINTTPTILEARRVSPTSIFVRWGPDAGLNTFFVQYGFENGNWQFNTKTSGFSTTINDLPANQSIWIQVAATDNCATGSYGPAVLVEGTAGGPRLPNTGFGPPQNKIPWYIPVGIPMFILIVVDKVTS